MSHALLSASGASRWLNCTPSARLESSVKRESSSVYAIEGTKAHALGEMKLRSWLMTGVREDFRAEDEEMQEYTSAYRDFVIEEYLEAKKDCPDAKLFIEQRLSFDRWVPGGFGTGDAVIIADGTCKVIDLKYGRGVQISAEHNPQLMLYGAGALEKFGQLYGITDLELIIYQPRLNNVSTFRLTTEELESWLNDEVKPKAELAFKGEGSFNPGEWCRFCKVKGDCKARAEEYFTEETPSPDLLSPDEIAELLPKIDTILKWAEDVKDFALRQALEGKSFKGFKLVEASSGRRKINNEEAFKAYLHKKGYEEQAYMSTPKLKPIGQLEKAFGRNLFHELSAGFIERTQVNPALAPETDKRRDWNSAEEDFKEELNDVRN